MIEVPGNSSKTTGCLCNPLAGVQAAVGDDHLNTALTLSLFNLAGPWRFVSAVVRLTTPRNMLDWYGKTRDLTRQIVLDKRPKMIDKALGEWAGCKGVRRNCIEPGKSQQNAIVEYFHERLGDERLDENRFLNLAVGQEIIDA